MHEQARTHPLDRFFNPRSIAVVGASANPAKLGYAQVKTILEGGYSGRVIPVNPNASAILGLETVADVSELPDGLDLAIVLLPAEKTVEVLRTLADKETGGAVIPAGGFAETGSAGAALQAEIRKIADESGMRILGPNVPGFINAAASLNATFAGGAVGSGNLAILSQAGSIGYLVLRNSALEQIPFGRFVCFGNQVDLSESDLLDYLGNDRGVGAICMYLESVRDGRRFLEVASRISPMKPIIALKGGRTAAGTGAIFSHTASISSPETIYRAAFRKAGVIWADDLGTLAASSMALAAQGGARGSRVAIITSLAGVGVVAADACESRGLEVPEPSDALTEMLKTIISAKGSTRNPIDLTGDITPAMLAATIHSVIESAEFDCILPLVMGVPDSEEFGNVAYAKTCAAALELACQRDIACALQWVSDEAEGSEIAEVRRILYPLGIPVCQYPENAVQILAMLAERGRYLGRRSEPILDADALAGLSSAGMCSDRLVLTEHESKALLEAADVPVAVSRLAKTSHEAVVLGEQIGFPVVLKLQSPDATHKSDVGGVVLNLGNAEAVRLAFEEMSGAFQRQLPGARLDGISVQPMVSAMGVELICGISEDPQFGKYLMIGLGGIAVEVMRDVSIRLLPVSDLEITEMLRELKSAPLLSGHRGSKPVDMDALVGTVSAVARLGGASNIAEIELNPLLASDAGIVSLDARIRVHAGASRAVR